MLARMQQDDEDIWAQRDRELIDEAFKAWSDEQVEGTIIGAAERRCFEAGVRWVANLHARPPRPQKDYTGNYKDLGTVLTLMRDANAHFIEIQHDLREHFDLPKWAVALVELLNEPISQLERSQIVRELYDRLWWRVGRLEAAWHDEYNSTRQNDEPAVS